MGGGSDAEERGAHGVGEKPEGAAEQLGPPR